MEKKPGFKKWLKAQEFRDDPIGDLAKDMIEEARSLRRNGQCILGRYTCLQKQESYLKMRQYLSFRGCQEAQDALKDAWEEWKAL